MKSISILLFLFSAFSNSAEKWIPLNNVEKDEIAIYLNKIIRLGSDGNIDEYLKCRIGPDYIKLNDRDIADLKKKFINNIDVDLKKLRLAASSNEMVWYIKPALVQIQFNEVNGDSVLVLGNKPSGWKDWVVLGFKNKYKTP